MPPTLRRATLAFALLAAAVGAEAARSTPEGLQPGADAWVVDAAAPEATVRFDVPLGRIARSGGRAQPKSVRRVEGRLASITWAWPRGTSSAAVFGSLREQLTQTPWFECSARACGDSNYWAHRVFGVADLYGRDELQHYVALPRTDGGAVLLYVAERATREVFAHLVEIVPDQQGSTRLVAGLTVREAAAPLARDALPEAVVAALPELLAGLRARGADVPFAVVVHALPGADEGAMVRSRRIAERLAARLEAEAGVPLTPHGVGALVPSALGAAELRVEIVELRAVAP